MKLLLIFFISIFKGGFFFQQKSFFPPNLPPQHGTAMPWGAWISESARQPGAFHWPWYSQCHPAQTGKQVTGDVGRCPRPTQQLEKKRGGQQLSPSLQPTHSTALLTQSDIALPHPAALTGMKPRSCEEHPALPTPLNRTGYSRAPGSNSMSVVVSILQSPQIQM